jgi:hypothetical protein
MHADPAGKTFAAAFAAARCDSEQLGVQAFREAALPCREPEKKEGRRLLREGDDDGAPIATLTRWGERPNARGERARWLELKTSLAHFGSGKSERKLV